MVSDTLCDENDAAKITGKLLFNGSQYDSFQQIVDIVLLQNVNYCVKQIL